MKQCSKCKEGKDESEFYNEKRNKDGLQGSCNKCMNQKNSECHANKREERNQQMRGYRQNHKKELNQKAKERRNSSLKYNSNTQLRNEIEKYEEIRESKNGNVECKCAYDGDGFEPTKQQIDNRLNAINGEGNTRGECRLYCSDKCKENCSTYNQSWYEKGHKPASSREVQPVLRKMVFARDNYTCQRCGYHKDELEVSIHCHHIEGIRGEPIESADMDTCITLCEDHHNEAHDEPGCRYNDLKCNA